MQRLNVLSSYSFKGGVCVSGSIHYRKDRKTYLVLWSDPKLPKGKRQKKITHYNGMKIGNNKELAERLLHAMQEDVANGFFRIEKYIDPKWSDIIELLDQWEKEEFDDLKPATVKAYKIYIKNWYKPFFKRYKYRIHEINLEVLNKLLRSIENRSGKYKRNVLYAFHQFLGYCADIERIKTVPRFPKKKKYKIITPIIKWIPENRQLNILEKIPDEHKPIFYFLKYTIRRPCEAIALHREDILYNDNDPDSIDGFIVRRSISARELVSSTKTEAQHLIPCHDELSGYIKQALKGPVISKYLFTNKTSKADGKRYSSMSLNRIWKKACQDAGEDISLYNGLKHSTCCQYINEKGLSKSQLQVLTDHARIESLDRYAYTEIAEKKRLMMAIPLETKKKVENG